MRSWLSAFNLTEKIPLRLFIVAVTVMLLVLNYFMMYFDYLTLFQTGDAVFFKQIENVSTDPDYKKVSMVNVYFSKFIRLVLNDVFSIVLLFMIFFSREVLRVSVYVLFFNAVILFPLVSYLLLHYPLTTRSISSPLHFIIMNPVLVFLLVPFFLLENNRQLGN